MMSRAFFVPASRRFHPSHLAGGWGKRLRARQAGRCCWRFGRYQHGSEHLRSNPVCLGWRGGRPAGSACRPGTAHGPQIAAIEGSRQDAIMRLSAVRLT